MIPKDGVNHVHSVLDSVVRWSSRNKPQLNIDKRKEFGVKKKNMEVKKNKPNICIQDSFIGLSSFLQTLGVRVGRLINTRCISNMYTK